MGGARREAVGGIGPKVRTFRRLSLEGTFEFNEIIAPPSSGFRRTYD